MDIRLLAGVICTAACVTAWGSSLPVNSPVELLLQALVGVVDAQLLEAVLLEALEAVDVQDGEACAAGALVAHRLCQSFKALKCSLYRQVGHALVHPRMVPRCIALSIARLLHDCRPHVLSRAHQRSVDLLDEPAEQGGVDALGERIPCVQSRLHLQVHVDRLATWHGKIVDSLPLPHTQLAQITAQSVASRQSFTGTGPAGRDMRCLQMCLPKLQCPDSISVPLLILQRVYILARAPHLP